MNANPESKSEDIKCPCCRKKKLAEVKDGVIYVWCKICKKSVPLIPANEPTEPKTKG